MKKNIFGLILDFIGNVVFVMGFLLTLALLSVGNDLPDWLLFLEDLNIFGLAEALGEVLDFVGAIVVATLTISLTIFFKVPGRIIILLADIEYNTRSKK